MGLADLSAEVRVSNLWDPPGGGFVPLVGLRIKRGGASLASLELAGAIEAGAEEDGLGPGHLRSGIQLEHVRLVDIESHGD